MFDAIRARGGQPSPLYRTLAHAPALLTTWAAFATALRTHTMLERSLSELVIMRLAQLSGAKYQWAYHWQPAVDAGVEPLLLQSLKRWRESPAHNGRGRAALGYAEAMFRASVSDSDMASLNAMFNPQEIVELTLTIGFYVNVGRVLQALQIEVDAEHQVFLP